MIVVKKALYKNFTNFKSKLSNYKGIFKNGIKICKCNREKKLIAVKKISFENFTNLKLEHLKYRGKDHNFYRILNSNSIYEFENNDKELIMRKFISDTKSKICEDEVYEYYKSINGLFSTHRYYDGVLHRTDGVAIEYKDRKYHDYYYINGNYINNNFFNKMVENIKNGKIVNILNDYNYKELTIVKTMIEEIGNKEELDSVNKHILIKKLEGEN